MKLETHYTIKELTEQLKVCDDTIFKLIKDGKLTASKIGRDWRIPESAITSYLKNRTLFAKA